PELLRDQPRLVQRPGAVDVERELDVRAHLLASSSDCREFDLMELERAEPRVDCPPDAGSNQWRVRIADQASITAEIGDTASQQTAQRHIGGLACDVPEGDVDRGHAK